MSVSSICLTVTHLPSSCSFFLAALAPLGYRYIAQEDNLIALGITKADFFLCQASSGTQPGTTFLTFSAPSQNAVDVFFGAALRAGGRNHGEPGIHDQKLGHYSAAVFDFDDNSIEVVYLAEDHDDGVETRSVVPSVMSSSQEGSRVLSWQKEVARSTAGSEVSVRSSRAPLQPIVNNISAPTYMVSQAAPPPIERSTSGDIGSKTIIGTLLGAAAGAALAYIMTKGESESSQLQSEDRNTSDPFTGLSQKAQSIYRAIEGIPIQTQPQPSVQQPATMVDTFPREYQQPSSASYVPSTISPRNQYQQQHQRAIEAPPHLTPINASYASQGYITMQDNTVGRSQPAPSRHEYSYGPTGISASRSPRSQISISRSYSDDLVARSQQAQSPSKVQNTRPSPKRNQTDILAVAVATISGARSAITAIEKALGPESIPLPASSSGSVLMGPGGIQYQQPTAYTSTPPAQPSPSKAPSSAITAIRTVPTPPSRPGTLIRAVTTEYIPATTPSSSSTRKKRKDEDRDRYSSSPSHTSRPKSSRSESGGGRKAKSSHSHSHSPSPSPSHAHSNKSHRSSPPGPPPRRKSKLNEVITPDDSISQISINRSTTSSASDDDDEEDEEGEEVTVIRVVKDDDDKGGSGGGRSRSRSRSRRHHRRHREDDKEDNRRTVVSLPIREREQEREEVKGGRRSVVGVGRILGGRGFGLLKGGS